MSGREERTKHEDVEEENAENRKKEKEKAYTHAFENKHAPMENSIIYDLVTIFKLKPILVSVNCTVLSSL